MGTFLALLPLILFGVVVGFLVFSDRADAKKAKTSKPPKAHKSHKHNHKPKTA